MPRKKRARWGENSNRKGPRHAAHRHAGTARFASAHRGAAALRRRAFPARLRARPLALGSDLAALEVTKWQVVKRAALTPAFGAAMMLCLVVTCLGTEARTVVAWLDGGAPTRLHGAPSPLRPADPEPPRGSPSQAPVLDNAANKSGSPSATGDHAPLQDDVDPRVFAKLEEVLAGLSHDDTWPQPSSMSEPVADSTSVQPSSTPESVPDSTTAQPSSTPEPSPDSTTAQPSTAGQPQIESDAPLFDSAPTDPANVPAIEQPVGAGTGPAT